MDGDTLMGGKGQDHFIIYTSSNKQKVMTTTISDFNKTQNDSVKILHNNILIHKVKSILDNLDSVSSSFKHHLIQIEQDPSITPETIRPKTTFNTEENIIPKTLVTTIKIFDEEI